MDNTYDGKTLEDIMKHELNGQKFSPDVLVSRYTVCHILSSLYYVCASVCMCTCTYVCEYVCVVHADCILLFFSRDNHMMFPGRYSILYIHIHCESHMRFTMYMNIHTYILVHVYELHCSVAEAPDPPPNSAGYDGYRGPGGEECPHRPVPHRHSSAHRD